MKKSKTVSNISVGKPDVALDAPAHVRGVGSGNDRRRQRHEEEGARRSTGIRPGDHETIDPRMPKLTPA